ncbi:hemin uptake protein HemP [Marinovum sp. 2_MG-2023]|uniref:hemin uptake protein HemP n=1 Tax=unclassified Marinovum TaxID=2647166 RepID=UPI0026E30270|nr:MULTISPECIES: hemin uptake protein HemP [unclassified Marinovum]MDO6728810.1 hemin uptake protein HemP [Marinovum sp. 2_MG-2023]MDO6777774.1 hemin uptake protein HemP [Marinovum sp. 1_MG-2023]
MNAIARPMDLLQNTTDDAGPAYDARMLVGHNATARIVLDGKVYTLRITKAGKLILTK